MKYTAVYCPRLEGKSGFNDKEEAVEHVNKHLCKGCNKALEDGFKIIGNGKDSIELEIKNVFETSCGAEWLIVTDEVWNNYLEMGDFSILLMGAGYEIRKREVDSN